MKYTFNFLLLIPLLLSSNTSAKFIEGADITEYLNQLIKKNQKVVIPPGTYRIDATKGVKLKSYTEIEMSQKTELQVIPNSAKSYHVFLLNNIKNASISGGKITGDKYTHLGKIGEWGMGIEIRDSQNIKISNMSIDKMWGDAIYIGTKGPNSSSNIQLTNISMDNNRRQGLSIISVDTLIAKNITSKNTSGTSPASGIDIEPNDGFKQLKNIVLENIYTFNNEGAGIQIGLSRYANHRSPISIRISNHFDKNSKYGILLGAVNPKSNGSINISNVDYTLSRTPSCFHSWTNNQISIKASKDIGFSKEKICNGYQGNSSFSFR
ncbi:TPA: right-handed parallel beta-helix repeat-containing protein [Acinetobacter baumannii]|nr:right-handed parallel beta-helix repeat-containing protein [Acinetobacter baumannii]